MVGAYVWLIRVFSSTINLLYILLVYLVEVMMFVMFVSAIFYVLAPSPEALATAVGVNMFVMVAGLVYVLGNAESTAEKRLAKSYATSAFSTLLVANEGAMGYLFYLVSPSSNFSPVAVAGAVYAAGGTYWFSIPVAIELLYVAHMAKGLWGPRYAPVALFLISPSLDEDPWWKAFSIGVSVIVSLYAGYSARSDRKIIAVYAAFVAMLLVSLLLPVFISPAYISLAFYLLHSRISEFKRSVS